MISDKKHIQNIMAAGDQIRIEDLEGTDRFMKVCDEYNVGVTEDNQYILDSECSYKLWIDEYE